MEEKENLSHFTEILEIDGIRFKKFDDNNYVPINQEETIKYLRKKFMYNTLATEKELSFEEYRQKIIDERLKEKTDLYNLTQEVIENTTYKNGYKKKEVVFLPMPTKAQVLKNKDISIRTYGAVMLESNWGGKILNPDDRYIYADKLDEVIKDISKEFKLSERTLKRYITKLRKCNVNILEAMPNAKGELIYKLNYSDENFKNYILIHDKALRKLVNAYSENTLRIYLILLYKCFDEFKDENTITYKECEMTQEYLCQKIGLKANSRKIIADCIEALARGGFIKIRVEYKTNYETKNKELLNYPIAKYFYNISKDYLKKNYISKS